MKIGIRSLSVLLATGLAFVLVLTFGGGTTVRADGHELDVDPWTFVGAVGDCGGIGSDPFNLLIPYAAGARIVTSEWLDGLGLPDKDTLLNASQPPYSGAPGNDPTDNPNKRNHRQGLVFSKNGPTEDCSAAGASVTGVRNMVVTANFLLGFDFRNGLHCGAGATRFNLVTRDPNTLVETFHFIGGCSNGTQTPAPQDPKSWTTVRFNLQSLTQAYPPVAVGDKIRTLDLVFDEGTTSINVIGNTLGSGAAIIDNIYVNGKFAREDRDERHKRGEREHDHD